MEHIFNKVGYRLTNENDGKADKVKLLYINNRDGSIRWIWTSIMKRPHFLKLYTVSENRSLFLVLLIRLVFALRLQRIIFHYREVFVTRESLSEIDFNILGEWALLTGAEYTSNKAVLFYTKDGIGTFYKIALEEEANLLLQRESMVLDRLFLSGAAQFDFPLVIEKGTDFIRLTDVSATGKKSSRIGNAHINALLELNELTAFSVPLLENDGWKKVKAIVEELMVNDDKRLPEQLIYRLYTLTNLENESEIIEVALSHGHFTSNSMFINKDRISVYDWEHSDSFKPLGYDLFHFIIQQGILEYKSWKEIRKDIDETVKEVGFSSLSKFNATDVEKYLRVYFLYNVSYCLAIYEKQAKWDIQVQRMLNVWNEALGTFMEQYSRQKNNELSSASEIPTHENNDSLKIQRVYGILRPISEIDSCTSFSTSKRMTFLM